MKIFPCRTGGCSRPRSGSRGGSQTLNIRHTHFIHQFNCVFTRAEKQKEKKKKKKRRHTGAWCIISPSDSPSFAERKESQAEDDDLSSWIISVCECTRRYDEMMMMRERRKREVNNPKRRVKAICNRTAAPTCRIIHTRNNNQQPKTKNTHSLAHHRRLSQTLISFFFSTFINM